MSRQPTKSVNLGTQSGPHFQQSNSPCRFMHGWMVDLPTIYMVDFVWEKIVGFSCTSFMGSCGFKGFAPSCFQKEDWYSKKIFPPPKRRDGGTNLTRSFSKPPQNTKNTSPHKKDQQKISVSAVCSTVGRTFWLPKPSQPFPTWISWTFPFPNTKRFIDFYAMTFGTSQHNPADTTKKRHKTQPHQKTAMTGRKTWGLHVY